MSLRAFFLNAVLVCASCGHATASLDDNSSQSSEDLSQGYTNPVIAQSFPDPSILKDGDDYFAYATNGRGGNVQVMSSKDLVHWSSHPDALPSLPSWAARGYTWGPAVRRISSDRYVMYFSARRHDGSEHCIGVATGRSATGPFASYSHDPLVCPLQEGGAIDPEPFVDVDGTGYLVWKNDGNAIGVKTWLQIQALSASGAELAGAPKKLLDNDQEWEGDVIEAPTLRYHDHQYFLVYSANNYATQAYSIGYATSDALLGPYTKSARWITSSTANGPVIGPGGQDIVETPNGHLALVYHSWQDGMHRRPMSIVPISWSGDRMKATASMNVADYLP